MRKLLVFYAFLQFAYDAIASCTECHSYEQPLHNTVLNTNRNMSSIQCCDEANSNQAVGKMQVQGRLYR